MADFHRIRQRQAITEAEGYLDLSMGFSDRWPLAPELQVRLAERALDLLKGVPGNTDQRVDVLYLTGQAYRAMQRYRDALGPLESAAELAPGNILIWLALAWCYKRIDRLDLAIESLENGLAVSTTEAIIHYNLACYWSLAGNAKLALQYLAQSFDIEPAYRDLVADESDFDPIRNLPDFQALTSVVV